MKVCYQCERRVHELSPRSCCVTCEYYRAQSNETENEILRIKIGKLEDDLDELSPAKELVMRSCEECCYGTQPKMADPLTCGKGHKPRFYRPKSGDFTSGEWGWRRRCSDFKRK